MDTTTLHTFLTVAELGSFSRAADRLYLSQPAISKRIAALEAELDTRLFDRIGRQVNLTESGSTLLPHARAILGQAQDSRRAIANLSHQISGRLTMGTSHHIGLHRLPPVLRHYSQHYPNVELDLQFMDSEAACRAVEHGDLELAVVTLPLQEDPALRVRAVWADPLAVVVTAGHPLTHRRSVALSDLGDFPAILPARGTYTRELIETQFAQLGMHPQISMSTNYLETIKMLVGVGLGWSVLPRSMLSSEVSALPIKALRLERTLGMVWHPQRTLSNAANVMMTVVSAVASGKTPEAAPV